MTPRDAVQRARQLVGTPFRAQGRNVEQGLDCVGLALAVFAIPERLVRRNYRIRGRHGSELVQQIERFFVEVAKAGPGDLLFCAVAADQFHLAVHCGESFIHANASLRRVIETPGPPKWPVRAFRKIQSGESE